MEEAIFMSEILFPSVSFYFLINLQQCLGSGSVGSARFWLPGSGSARICESTDPGTRRKISTKNWREKIFNSKDPVETDSSKISKIQLISQTSEEKSVRVPGVLLGEKLILRFPSILPLSVQKSLGEKLTCHELS